MCNKCFHLDVLFLHISFPLFYSFAAVLIVVVIVRAGLKDNWFYNDGD